MVGIRTFLRRTWGRVWIYSFFALLLMIALSFIQHVIGGINWEAFQYPAEDGKPNVFVDDINHPQRAYFPAGWRQPPLSVLRKD